MAGIVQYYLEPNMLQTLNMTTVKIVKWIITWKNIHFADLVKDAQSFAGFSPCHKF